MAQSVRTATARISGAAIKKSADLTGQAWLAMLARVEIYLSTIKAQGLRVSVDLID